jgi:hypothetical protein
VPEQKVKITIPNLGPVDGTEVPLTESIERWTELRLEDGAVLRVKPLIMKVIRIDGRYDPQGNPLYALQGGQVMTVVSAPEHLRQSAAQKSKVQ